MRERFGSPPFGRIVKLTVGLHDRDAAQREATAMADRLRIAGGGAPGRSHGRRDPPPRTSPDAPTVGAGTSSSAGSDPVALLDGGAGRSVVRRRRPRIASVRMPGERSCEDGVHRNEETSHDRATEPNAGTGAGGDESHLDR